MRSFRLLLIVAVGGSTMLGSWVSADSPRPVEPENPFHKDLLKVAAEYKTWGRVDDEMRWAPGLCRAPQPGRAHVSASNDQQTHGQKLYSLFARHHQDYFYLAKGKTAVVGQVLVKQSWVPEEITNPKEKPEKRLDYAKVIHTPIANPDPRRPRFDHEGDHFYPYVWKGDKVFKATKQADLFIMMKLDPKTPGTDTGWVYATVTPDGKKVTSAGALASCMKCHREAKSDRLFGLWR
jgi:hypothetical protein